MKVSVQSITASFGQATVLRQLSLEIEDSTTVTLLGPSGTGKSTFLRAISGLGLAAGGSVKGSIVIDGKSPGEFMATGQLGFVFQNPSLFPNLSVEENIKLPLRLRDRPLEYAEYLLRRVGLTDSRHKLPASLSGGMKTRVSLARTLVTKPKMLLLDEPFSALDLGWRYRLYKDYAQIQAELGVLSILVTHDIEEALLLSHRVIVLGTGGSISDDITLSGATPRILQSDPLARTQPELSRLQKHFIDA